MSNQLESKLKQLNTQFNEFIETNEKEMGKLNKRNQALLSELRETENKMKKQKEAIENNKKKIALLKLKRLQSPQNINEKIQSNDRKDKIIQLQEENQMLLTKNNSIILKTNEVIEQYNTLLDLLTNSKHFEM